MRILHIIPTVSVSYGGPVTTMGNMVAIWNSGGIASEVLALEKPGKSMAVATTEHILRASFPKRYGNSSESLKWLAYNIHRFSLIVFHATWTILCLRAAQLCRKTQIPYIVIPHGSLDPFDLRKKRIAKRILGPILVRPFLDGSVIVVCSTALEAQRLVTYGSKPNIAVLSWAVEKEVADVTRDEIRLSLGVKANDFLILCLGRVDYKKGFPILIPAVRKLLDSGISARLLIVGPDTRNYSNKVRKMVRRAELMDAVTFLPPVIGREKVGLMRAADCFALPSLNENFGNVVVEAMQHGLPVVITHNVYIANDVARAGAGLVCGYDADEVCKALRRLATEPATHEAMSSAGKELGEQFGLGVLRDKYLNFIKEIMAGAGDINSGD